MNKSFRLLLGTLLAAGLVAMSPFLAIASSTVVPPDQTYAGKTYGQWSAAWWQWAAPMPAQASPVSDTTGVHCGVKQDGPVWFLAGTSGGTVTRQCTIPNNLGIFFPIINAECSSVEGNG